MSSITYIDEVNITNKTVLLRVDFNVSLNSDRTISDDMRIRQSLPTINLLLKNKNKIILVSHLDRPKKRDPKYSLKVVADYLSKYLPDNKIVIVDDFLTEKDQFSQQKSDEVIILENIRFYKEEKTNDSEFAKKLASLAEVYVNDAFGASHREDTSIIGIPIFLPSYGGLLLKKEIKMISKAIDHPKKPIAAIMGGAKISTKINLINRLIDMTDYLLIGGGLANTFFRAQKHEIGKSYYEQTEVENAQKILDLAQAKKTKIILPVDVVVDNHENNVRVSKLDEVSKDDNIVDIGPETQALFGSIIAKANTIIWNGPVGYIEDPKFRRGTDFIYYSITHNQNAVSIVGGGDTLVAISKKEYLNKITHVSTGGGAMLEFIEKGTLPGFEALKKPKSYNHLTKTLLLSQTA